MDFCEPALCHECHNAVKTISKTGDSSEPKQGEQQNALVPTSGKGIALEIQENDPNLQLANIIVELEDGCIERIQMNDSETAEEVAQRVCLTNNLPEQFVALLAEHIIYRYPEQSVDQQKQAEITSNDESKGSSELSHESKESSELKHESKEK